MPCLPAGNIWCEHPPSIQHHRRRHPDLRWRCNWRESRTWSRWKERRILFVVNQKENNLCDFNIKVYSLYLSGKIDVAICGFPVTNQLKYFLSVPNGLCTGGKWANDNLKLVFLPAWVVWANESCCMIIDPLSAQACMLTIKIVLWLLLGSVPK